MTRSVLLAIPAFILISIMGCAKPKYNYSALETSFNQPNKGEMNTSYVGDPMLSKGKYKENDAIYIKDKIDVIWAYTLLPGHYLKQGEDEVGEFYYPGGAEPGHIDKAMLADPWKSVMVRKDPPAICVITIFHVATCNSEHQNYFERRKTALVSPDSFQQTLIYNGKVGSKINIGYREFSGNMARPAFSNNVEYDLSESPVIGYKGAKLEVIEANNQFVRFRVLDSFKDSD